jgi:hypothetical protein
MEYGESWWRLGDEGRGGRSEVGALTVNGANSKRR